MSRTWSVLALCALLALCAPNVQAFPWPNQALKIERQLEQGTREEKLRAAAALGSLSPPMAHRAVQLALLDGERRVRLLGARRAEQCGFADLAETVVPWLKEGDTELSQAALTLLALAPERGALSEVSRLLASGELELRISAARVLGRASPEDATVTNPSLRAGLGDGEPRVRAASVEALGHTGERQDVLLLGLRLEDADTQVRLRAAVALGALGEPVAERNLVLALGDRDSSVRLAALRSLGELGQVSSVNVLLAQARHVGWSASNKAAVASLGAIVCPEAAAGLVELLGRKEGWDELWPALEAQGALALPPLRQCLEQAAGAELSACAQLWLQANQPSERVLGVWSAGRLDEVGALVALAHAKHPDEDALVFALERLGHGEARVREGARAVLGHVERWEPALLEPVRSAVLARGLGARERALLLDLLAGDTAQATEALARTFLDSTEPLLKRSAARVVVRARPSLEDVLGLLAQPLTRATVSDALAEGLSEDLGSALLERYRTLDPSPRAALRRAFRGLPKAAASRIAAALARELEVSQGEEAAELLAALAELATASPFLGQRARVGSLAERRALAQWAAFRPDAELARALGSDGSLEVRALAWQSAGRRGALVESATASSLTRRERLAKMSARLQWLRADSGRKLEQVGEFEALLDGTDPAARLLALGLLQLSKQADAAVIAERRLRLDPHPVVRRAAARWLRADGSPAARRALRVCAAYDIDSSVARSCEGAEAPAHEEPGRPALVRIFGADGVTPAASTAVALWDEGALYFGLTDPAGQLVLPSAETSLLEPGLGF